MAESQHDGGAAFPVVTNQYHYAYEKDMPATVEPGMSLRDYFAAKAMQGFAACDDVYPSLDAMAAAAYRWADAMLKARKQEAA